MVRWTIESRPSVSTAMWRAAARPVVLKALAKLAYDLNFSNRKPEDADELYQQFLTGLPETDFSHSNPIWNYHGRSDGERLDAGLMGLETYLPDDTGGNRDIGSMQSDYMRFGAKHNDIFPILTKANRHCSWLT